MKRIIAVALAILLVLSLAACGSTSGSAATPAAKNAKIATFVESNKQELLETMESSFAESAGMTCTSDIKVEGMGFVISININELDNIDDAAKEMLQQTYDAMSGTFDAALETMQQDLPELEYFEVQVCEQDGDLLATIVVGTK